MHYYVLGFKFCHLIVIKQKHNNHQRSWSFVICFAMSIMRWLKLFSLIILNSKCHQRVVNPLILQSHFSSRPIRGRREREIQFTISLCSTIRHTDACLTAGILDHLLSGRFRRGLHSYQLFLRARLSRIKCLHERDLFRRVSCNATTTAERDRFRRGAVADPQ